MIFVKQRKIFYILSGSLVLTSIIALVTLGLPLGIDFKGGSLLELQFNPNEEGEVNAPSRDELQSALSDLELGAVQIQMSDDNTALLRFRDIDEETHESMIQKIDEVSEADFEEIRFDSVGPVIGRETAEKAAEAMVFVVLMILAYVAWAFRKIHQPIGSVRYGVIALVALFHDVIISAGIFAIYAKFTGTEVGVPFIAALLTILGYSVNDTIVVFDRVRENLLRFGSKIDFEELVSNSVKETLARSINTGATTLFVLLAIFIFGGATIKNFVFTLMVGIAFGVYSSIALASPLLVSWAKKLSS